MAITFSSRVTFVGGDSNAAAAFTLNRVSPSPGAVTLAASVNNTGPGTKVTLWFTGGTADNISLADGRYSLQAIAANFASGLDGNGDGVADDDFIFEQPPAAAPLDLSKIFRLFWDVTGDGVVAANDFIQSLQFISMGSGFAFDFDNDGAVAVSDLRQFRLRFGGSV